VALAAQGLQRLGRLDAAHQAVQVVRVVLERACRGTGAAMSGARQLDSTSGVQTACASNSASLNASSWRTIIVQGRDGHRPRVQRQLLVAVVDGIGRREYAGADVHGVDRAREVGGVVDARHAGQRAQHVIVRRYTPCARGSYRRHPQWTAAAARSAVPGRARAWQPGIRYLGLCRHRPSRSWTPAVQPGLTMRECLLGAQHMTPSLLGCQQAMACAIAQDACAWWTQARLVHVQPDAVNGQRVVDALQLLRPPLQRGRVLEVRPVHGAGPQLRAADHGCPH